jgi:hypothetical protein
MNGIFTGVSVVIGIKIRPPPLGVVPRSKLPGVDVRRIGSYEETSIGGKLRGTVGGFDLKEAIRAPNVDDSQFIDTTNGNTIRGWREGGQVR